MFKLDRVDIRRFVTAVLGIVGTAYAVHYYEWHKDQFSFGNSFGSLLWAGCVVVAAGAIIWLLKSTPSRFKIIASAVLTAVVVIWGNNVLDGIKAKDLWILLGVTVAILAYLALILLDNIPFIDKSSTN